VARWPGAGLSFRVRACPAEQRRPRRLGPVLVLRRMPGRRGSIRAWDCRD